MNSVFARNCVAILATFFLGLAACSELAGQAEVPEIPHASTAQPLPADAPLSIAAQGNFYVGGQYTDVQPTTDRDPAIRDGTAEAVPYMRYYGQMYTQFQIPAGQTQPYPIVLVHGGSRSGADYFTTPDGRPGWVDFFLRRGYPVYVVDQVARGRSPYIDNVYGPSRYQTYDFVMQRFAASENYDLWPQAHAHTRWPGTAKPGDPIFDNYYAGGIGSMQNREMQTQMNVDALAALLDRIGPSIVLVHSQSGSYGWPLVQARPDLVKALVALEPAGPPVYGVGFHGAPDWFSDEGAMKAWGLTDVPLAYQPALNDPAELSFVQQDRADTPEQVRCWTQAEPARRLTGFENAPILVMESEASFYAPYNHCTVKYLEQAGVEATYVRTQDVGLPGGGHMFMIEQDSDAVAQLIADWLKESLPEMN